MDINQEERTPEEDEEFALACKIRADDVVNRLTGGKAKKILQENGKEAMEIRRAAAFQAQHMYFHPESFNDDCDPVSVFVITILRNAGVLKLF